MRNCSNQAIKQNWSIERPFFATKYMVLIFVCQGLLHDVVKPNKAIYRMWVRYIKKPYTLERNGTAVKEKLEK